MGKPDRLYPDIDRLQEYLSRGGRSKARQDGYVYAKEYPIVLVPGFLGFPGLIAPFTRSNYHYFGGTLDYAKALADQGWKVICPQIGPVSSNWERACDLYAQLTHGSMDGLTYDIIVDYGTPSSNDPNVFFSDPPPKRRQAACHNMDPNWKWSANSPVHFIAHSQGGNTCRYLIHLLDNGFNADSTFLEKGSQYFTTPQKGWVKSLTTLATPHNGSSVINALDKIGPVQENVLNKFILTAALKEPKTRIFDFCLDHRGICPPPSRATKESAHKTELTSEKGALTLWRRSKFNGFHDNSIPGTIGQLNKIIREPSPDVYYFTLSTASTTSVFKNDFKKLRAFGNGLADGLNAHLPRSLPSFSGVGTTMTRPGTFVGFQPMAPYMCAYRPSPDEETMIEQAGGPINPHDWHEHDGVVPTCSMAGPFGNPRVDVADIVRHGGGLKHGIWVNLGKEGSVDHAACIGVGAGDEMQELYVRISKLLSVLP